MLVSKLEYLVDIMKTNNVTEARGYNVSQNYVFLIDIFNILLKERSWVLENESTNIILNQVLRNVWDKISNDKSISEKEAEVFLYTLYYDSLKYFDIDETKIDKMSFTSDPANIKSTSRGVHYPLGNGHSEIYYASRNISLLSEAKDGFIPRLISLIAVPHELIHAQQHQHAVKGIVDLCGFICSLEDVVRKVSNYYEDNYFFTGIEADANSRGYAAVGYFLVSRKLADNSYLNKFYRDVEKAYNSFISGSRNKIVKIGNVEDVSGRVLLSVCSDYVKKDTSVISEYPLLSMVYNSDGSLKTVGDIFSYRRNLIDSDPKNSKKIDEVYDYIFDCYFSEQRDLSKLMDVYRYLESVNGNDEYASKIFVDKMVESGSDETKVKEYLKVSFSGNK